MLTKVKIRSKNQISLIKKGLKGYTLLPPATNECNRRVQEFKELLFSDTGYGLSRITGVLRYWIKTGRGIKVAVPPVGHKRRYNLFAAFGF